MTPPFIPLTRLRALGVVVAWHEGVAIAQRCAEQLAPHGTRAGLDTCAISVTGAVRVGGVSAEPFAYDPLFSLVSALVDTSNAPAELVAVLSRPDVRDSRAREDLMRELAFFSRPDAAAAIAAVAARALAKEAESGVQGELERLRAEAIATPAKAKAAPVRRRLPTRRVVVAAGGLGVLVAAGSAVSMTPWPSTSALAQSSPLTAVTATIDRLLDRGLQSLGAAAMEPPAVASPAAPAPSNITRRRTADVAAPAAAPPSLQADSPAPAPDVEAGTPVEPIEAPAPRRIDTSVYSSQDREVQPPALTHPQLPSVLPEADRAASNYLELLVTEHGTVERVRLQSPRSSLHERMLVSAAKAWRFRPAVKDGQPVKYVTRIAVPR